MKRRMPIKRLLSVGIAVSAFTIAQIGMTVPAHAQQAATCTVIEIYGKVDSVAGGKAVIRGFTVDLATAQDDDAVRTLKVGQFVEVEGCLKADGTIEAGDVDNIPATRARTKIEIYGVIEEVTPTSIKVGGIVFVIDTGEVETELVVGRIVKIEATKDGDTWLVNEVEAGTDDDIKRPEEDDDEEDTKDDDKDDDKSGSDDDKDDHKGGSDDDKDDHKGGSDDDKDDHKGGSDDDKDDHKGGSDDDKDDHKGGSDDDKDDHKGGSDDGDDDGDDD